MAQKPYVLLDRDGTMIVEASIWPIRRAWNCYREQQRGSASCKPPESD